MKSCPQCHTSMKDQELFCPNCGTKVLSQQMEEHAAAVASVWPDWQLETELGKGSYGVVYKACRTQNNLQSHAAIKIISIPANEGEVSSLRLEGLDQSSTRSYFKELTNEFIREVQVMESFKGVQNIVSVEDYKVVEHTDRIRFDIFIRMELLTPFVDHACNAPLTEEQIITLGCDICSALELCNREQVIHRDIKPENIFVNHFGHYKLGDFGIARTLENSTGGLSQKGTYNYMAPEVASSADYDHRVDIYSLGMVLYRLLNNNLPPFLSAEKRLNPTERKLALDRRLKGEALPPPANASSGMAAVILKACAYSPNHRYANATSMKQALLQLKNKPVNNKSAEPNVSSASPRKPVSFESNTPADKTVSVRAAKQTTPPPPKKPVTPVKTVSSFDASKKKKIKTRVKRSVGSAILKVLLAICTVVIVTGILFLSFNITSIIGIITDPSYVEGTVDEENSIYTNRWAGISFDFSDYTCGTSEDYRTANTSTYTCVLHVQNETQTQKLSIGYEELEFSEYLFTTEQEYAATARYTYSLQGNSVGGEVSYHEETLCGERYTVAQTIGSDYVESLYVRKHQGYMTCIVVRADSKSGISKMLNDFSTP